MHLSKKLLRVLSVLIPVFGSSSAALASIPTNPVVERIEALQTEIESLDTNVFDVPESEQSQFADFFLNVRFPSWGNWSNWGNWNNSHGWSNYGGRRY